MMLNVKPKCLVNEKGHRTAALLSMKEYRALMQRLQDLEGALELDEAVETATGFREYAEFVRTCKRKEISEGRNGLHVKINVKVFAAGGVDNVLNSTFCGDSP